MNKLFKISEILQKYPEEGFGSEHDELYLYVDPAIVSEEDKQLLETLGCHVSDFDSFMVFC